MSIISALYAGVSGIKSFSTAIQVIGHNLANVNTIGYKYSRPEFADLLSQNLAGHVAGQELGRGTFVRNIARVNSQGTFTTTDVNTDVAIKGKGYFLVVDPNSTEQYFTRNGQFRLDDEGFLVNSLNYRVMGFQYDQVGNPTPSTGEINLTNLVTAPNTSKKVFVSANLNADVETPTPAFDPTLPTFDPAQASNFSSSIRVHDSLGADHEVSIYFRKTSDLNWEWYAMVPSAEIQGGVNEWTIGAQGQMVFTETGALDQEITTLSDFDFVGGATQNQVIDFDFGDSITTDLGSGLAGTTQFSSPSVVNYQSQDGYSAGNLTSVAIDELGVITGLFSNGRTRALAQLGIASFPNDGGLIAVGNNLYKNTPQSGQFTLLEPGKGPSGNISSNALELSNVDMANEFVAMIQNQRAYQANTRIVTVGDQLLSETVNLVR